MLPLTEEWIEKADGDYATAGRERRARKAPNYTAVCFHAQQCAEKYLKAFLQEQNCAFERTRDLIVLLDLVLPLAPEAEGMREGLRMLTTYAVRIRYPGLIAGKTDAIMTLRVCIQTREWARRRLGLPA